MLKPIASEAQSDQERSQTALLTPRSQLVDLIIQEKNRLNDTWDAHAKKTIQTTLKHLENELESID